MSLIAIAWQMQHNKHSKERIMAKNARTQTASQEKRKQALAAIIGAYPLLTSSTEFARLKQAQIELEEIFGDGKGTFMSANYPNTVTYD